MVLWRVIVNEGPFNIIRKEGVEMSESPLYHIFVQDYTRLCVLATEILHDHALAQDAVQQSWLRLQGMSKLETSDAEKLRHLVMITVRHTACNMRRKRSAVPVDDEVWSAIQDDAPPSHANMEKREISDILMAAMDQLAETDRTILHLQYGQDLTSSQIAKIMGMKPATIRQRSRRAKQALKTALEKEGLTYDDLS